MDSTKLILKRICCCTSTLVLITILSSCAMVAEGPIKQMRIAGLQEISPAPQKGAANVIFVRPKDVVNQYQCGLFDVQSLSADPNLIGILAANSSTVYETQPGKHLFMSLGYASQADFIKTDLLPDVTYYVLVDAQLSNWGPYRVFLKSPKAAGFSLTDMKTKFEQSRILVKSPESEQWAKNNMPSIRAKLATFEQKSANGEVPNLND